MSGKSTTQSAKDTAAKPATAEQLPAQSDPQNLHGNAYLVEQAQMGDHDHHHHHHHHHAAEPGARSSSAENSNRQPNSELPAETQQSLKDQLQSNSATEPVMRDIITHGRGLAFKIRWSTGGGYYDGTDIFIDPNEPANEWFGTMAHEIVHMRNDAIGKEGNIRTDTREDYVRKQMEDEIEGQAICFGALIEEGTGSDSAAGYNRFLEWMRTNRSDLMECAEDGGSTTTEIIELAKTWLEDKYRNEWQTSTTGQNYYDYWGGAWDRANQP